MGSFSHDETLVTKKCPKNFLGHFYYKGNFITTGVLEY